MAYTAIETRKAAQHVSMLSKQYKIQRMHRSNTTRWMHDSDDIIPIREPEHASWKVLFQGVGLMCAMTVLLFLVWWYGG